MLPIREPYLVQKIWFCNLLFHSTQISKPSFIDNSLWIYVCPAQDTATNKTL